MKATAMRTLLGLGIGLLTFAASFGMVGPDRYARVGDALELVETDAEHTVCGSGVECLSRDAAYTLFVFFSPRDCAISLYDTVVLDSLYRSVPRSMLNVVAVAYDLSPEEASEFAAASGISYPVYANPERLERYVGNPRAEDTNKPVRLLVNRTGKIVSAVTSRTAVRHHHDESRRLFHSIAAGGAR